MQNFKASASAPWTPASLPNLIIAIEGDDVSATGSSIDQFNAKWGTSINWTSSSTARATVASADLNGVNTAQFDGTSDWYSCSSTAQILAEGTAHTSIRIVKRGTFDGAGDFDVFANLKGNTNRCWQEWDTNQASYSENAFGFANAGGSANAIVRTSPSLGTSNYQCMVTVYSGGTSSSTGSYTQEKNGASVTVNTAANATATYANELGRWSSGGLFWKGHMALWFVMTSAIAASDLASLETWINTKYGITFS